MLGHWVVHCKALVSLYHPLHPQYHPAPYTHHIHTMTINQSNNDLSTTHTAYHGHETVADKLLEAGAKVDRATTLGFTALFYAAQREHIQIVKLLLEQGADPGLIGRPGGNNDLIWLCAAGEYKTRAVS